MAEDIIQMRKHLFRKKLVTLTYIAYLSQQKNTGTEDFVFKQWPSSFDREKVPKIPEAKLKSVPKLHRAESIDSYLKKFDIRE